MKKACCPGRDNRRLDEASQKDVAMSSVIKVGGSLLSFPDLAVRIKQLIKSCNDDRVALLIGGAEAADAVREWDRTFKLTPIESHQLAIEAMSLTASFAEKLISGTKHCWTRYEVEVAWSTGRTPILDACSLIEELIADGCNTLPAGWHVTSDSIAAWLSIHWPFDRVIFAKSVDAPADLAATDTLDAYLPILLPRLSEIWWCNLRAPVPVAVNTRRADEVRALR